MCEIKAVAAYIFKKYPKDKRQSLTLERIVKVIYLADWKASLMLNKQITDSKWKIVLSEPCLKDNSIDSIIDLIEIKKLVFENLAADLMGAIKPKQKKLIDFVIRTTCKKTDKELTLLVNSTFPAVTQDSTDDVDLPFLANRYTTLFPGLAKNAREIIA